MLFITGLLTLLAIAQAGGDHIKGGSVTQQKVAQEDIIPSPFNVKSAATPFGTKTIQPAASDPLSKTAHGSALHHAIKTAATTPGKTQLSPGLHHAASSPVIQDQVTIEDPGSGSIKSVKTLKTATTRFSQQEIPARDPIARPVVQTTKTVQDPVTGTTQIKTVKMVDPLKSTFSQDDKQVRDPIARPVIQTVKSAEGPVALSSKGIKSLGAASTKTRLMQGPAAQSIVQTVKTSADPSASVVTKSVKTTAKTAETSNLRSKTSLKTAGDLQRISNSPLSIVEAAKRRSSSANAASPNTQGRIQTSRTSQGLLFNALADSEIQSGTGIVNELGEMLLDEETLQKLQNAGGIINENGRIALNDVGVKLLQSLRGGSISTYSTEVSRTGTSRITSGTLSGQRTAGTINPSVNIRSSSIRTSSAASGSSATSPANAGISRSTPSVNAPTITSELGEMTLDEKTLQTLQNAGGVINENGRIALNDIGIKLLQSIRSGSTSTYSSGVSRTETSRITSGAAARRRTTGAVNPSVNIRTSSIRTSSATSGSSDISPGISRSTPAVNAPSITNELGEMMLDEKTLQTLQNAGGIINENGQIALNDVGIKLLQSIRSGSLSTYSSGVSRTETSRITSGTPARRRTTGALNPSVNIRTSSVSSAAFGSSAVSPGSAGISRSTPAVNAPAITNELGEMMLDEKTLQTLQNAGGIINENGRIALNDIGIKLLQSIRSGSISTYTSGVSRTETSRITSGAAARRRTTGAVNPSVNIRTSSITTSSAASGSSDISPGSAGISRSIPAVNAPGITNELGEMMLDEKTLQTLQNAGGVINENGRIALNDIGIKLLQSIRGGSISTYSTGVSRTQTSRIAGGTPARRRTTGAVNPSVNIRTSSVRTSTLGTGSSAMSPGSGSTSRNTPSVNAPRITSELGEMTLDEKTLQTLQNAGGIINENGRIALNDVGIKLLQSIRSGSISTYSSSVSRTGTSRIASETPTGQRTTPAINPLVDVRTSSIRTSSAAFGSRARSPGSTGISRSTSVNAPTLKNELGEMTLDEKTLQTLQNAGGIINENGRIALNDVGIKLLQRIRTGSVSSYSSGVSRTETSRITSGRPARPRTTGALKPSVNTRTTSIRTSSVSSGSSSLSPGSVGTSRFTPAVNAAAVTSELGEMTLDEKTLQTLQNAGGVINENGRIALNDIGIKLLQSTRSGSLSTYTSGVSRTETSRITSGTPARPRTTGAVKPSVNIRTSSVRTSSGAIGSGALSPARGGVSRITPAVNAPAITNELGEMTLDEKTLQTLQNAGGVINENGRIALNDIGIKLLQSIRSGSVSTYTSGVSRTETSRIASGTPARPRTTGAVKPSVNIRTSSVRTSSGAIRTGALSPAGAGVSRITPSVNAPAITNELGQMTLDEKTLQTLQNAGGVINENGRIALNDIGIKLLQSMRSGSVSTYTSGVSRTETSRIASGTPARPRTTGAVKPSANIRTSSIRTSSGAIGTGALSPASGGVSRITPAVNAPVITNELGEMTLDEKTLQTLQNAGGVINENGRIALNDIGIKLLQSIRSGSVSTYTSGVSRTESSRIASGTPARPRTTGAVKPSANIRTSSIRTNSGAIGTGALSPASGGVSRITPAVNAPVITNELGEMTLDEKTLQTLQNAGGVINENGRIALNDIGIKLLQSIRSGSVSTYTSGVSRTETSRIASGTPARPRTTGAVKPSANIRTSSIRTSSGATGTGALSPASGGVSRITPAVNAPVITNELGEMTLDEKTLQTLQNAGGVINENGRIALNDIGIKLLQSIRSGSVSTYTSGVSRTETSRIASGTPARSRTTGAAKPSANIRTSSIRTSSGAIGTAALSTASGGVSRITPKVNAPVITNELGEMTLDEKTLQALQNAGGVVNENGRIALNDIGIKLLQSIRSGSVSTYTSGVSRTETNRITSGTPGRPRTTGAVKPSVNIRTSAIRSSSGAIGTGALSPASGGVSRITPAVNAPAITNELGEMTLDEKTLQTLQNAGGIINENGRIALNDIGIKLLQSIRSGSVSTYTSGVSQTETTRLTSGTPARPRTRGRPVQGSQTAGLRSTAITDSARRITTGSRTSNALLSRSTPSVRSGLQTTAILSGQGRTQTMAGLSGGSLGTAQNIGQGPSVSSVPLTPNAPGSGVIRSGGSLTSGTVLFQGKEIKIDGVKPGQMFDENLRPITTGTSGAVSDITMNFVGSTQTSDAPSRNIPKPKVRSSQRVGGTSSRVSATRSSSSGAFTSSRISGSSGPQSNAGVRAGGITSSTRSSQTLSGGRLQTSTLSGTALFNGKEIAIDGLKEGQVFDENLRPITTGTLGSLAGRMSTTLQRSGQISGIPSGGAAPKPGMRSQVSGLRSSVVSGSSRGTVTGSRNPALAQNLRGSTLGRIVSSAQRTSQATAGIRSSTGSVLFNGKEISMEGLKPGQLYDENLRPITTGAEAGLRRQVVPQRNAPSAAGSLNLIDVTRTDETLTPSRSSSGSTRMSSSQRNTAGGATAYTSPFGGKVTQDRITPEISQYGVDAPIQESIIDTDDDPFKKASSISRQSQLKMDDVIEQSSFAKSVQAQETVPFSVPEASKTTSKKTLSKISQLSQKDIDIPAVQQKLLGDFSGYLPKTSFLPPFNYAIPEASKYRSPMSQVQQKWEQVFV